ncbi:MAG TPA: acyl-[acyl-carrier-protein] thioesterase [Candidatus Lachnoclostridium pullistercoris]|uniref:Acyl-[acyl-carrier-protein] thioesterase n=1 Tax=Candidatus Lachnoclostridium pullistercoris TaxID=2838632 RepID=A0A9D2P970_9FIRM|nr:acyl-[acyl-carrier-protein] thioesterase [Candidatus Lachnoclostridium pullistercoris]
MYSFDSRVRYSETDENGTLSVTAAVNYFQDCSTFQSEDLGVGVRYLTEHGRAWWLSSWQIVFDRCPALGEPIVIATYPYDFKGIYGYRNFMILDREGNYLVRANSVWFLYDLKAGHPIRVTEADVSCYGSPKAEPLPMDYAAGKLAPLKEYHEEKRLVVGRHHIDTNHHMNNARYAEMAAEFLPANFRVGELRMEYRKAAVLGDVIVPRTGFKDGGIAVELCSPEGERYAAAHFFEKRGKV